MENSVQATNSAETKTSAPKTLKPGSSDVASTATTNTTLSATIQALMRILSPTEYGPIRQE